MKRRAAIAGCLVVSGLTALVYQIVWTRLLGFAFGTTTAAIGTVLAVFFAGLALGNFAAARSLHRLRRPLRTYALLELGIGGFAWASLPLLRHFDALYDWVGVDHSAAAMAAIRLAAAAVILLPPTAAMGATLPLVARAVVSEDASRGRWSALLYGVNTLGAVLGAYLCGFWLIPELGLSRSLATAGALNLAVGLAALWLAARAVGPATAQPPAPTAEASARGAFLACFGVSGFVAIGYEIVWSRVFGIVMEGTLYGFAAVLSAFLLGIALGSLAMAPFVDRIRDLPRAFGWLHVGIAVCVAAGLAAVPYLPHALQRLASAAGGGDAVHLLFALVAPLVLLPTALFGAAFPVLIRITTHRAAGVGRGVGLATAVNTAGAIAASLIVSFWWIPELGTDAAAYLLVLIDLCLALWVLARFQTGPGPARLGGVGAAAAVLLAVAIGFPGVGLEEAIAGRSIRALDLPGYRRQLERVRASQVLVIEGRSSIVSVEARASSRTLATNGLPEAGVNLAPPYLDLESVLLGLLPALTADAPQRALVIGLGGGTTVSALGRAGLESIEVVEIEGGVAQSLDVLLAGRANPLEDPRVTLRINDGRNELLLAARSGGPGYDVIASQPSHPWRIGAANLFTEEFFRLARANLSASGRFALWVNGFRTDSAAWLAIATSFERVFRGALLLDIDGEDGRGAFLLLGAREPITLDATALAERLQREEIRELLAQFGIRGAADLLARCEGPLAAFAAIEPDAANTDDNAFVETRGPRQLAWHDLDFAEIEARLAPDAPVLPPLRGPVDVAAVARSLLKRNESDPRWPYGAKLRRLLRQHRGAVDPLERHALLEAARLREPATEPDAAAALRRLAAQHPERAEPLRLLGAHLAARRSDHGSAAEAFADAFARSSSPDDAYQTGRALYRVDPSRAWPWFDRIPERERPRFPRLAFYAAARALEDGARGDALRPLYAELRRYRDTREGRESGAANELLSRMAYTLGDVTAARGFADVARHARLQRGQQALRRASASLAAGRIEHARAELERAQRLLPADGRVMLLRGRVAVERGDRAALEAALGDLRSWAPSLWAAVVAENRFRTAHGLPLLPERDLEELSDAPF